MKKIMIFLMIHLKLLKRIILKTTKTRMITKSNKKELKKLKMTFSIKKKMKQMKQTKKRILIYQNKIMTFRKKMRWKLLTMDLKILRVLMMVKNNQINNSKITINSHNNQKWTVSNKHNNSNRDNPTNNKKTNYNHCQKLLRIFCL